jgi:uncharacterized protein YkwD
LRRTARGYLGTAALITLGLATTASPAAAGCPGASASATSTSPGKLRSALLCVVNGKRRANGLAPLKANKRIQRAAGRHARDMERHHYFAHQRAGGPDLTQRLHRAGWYGHAWGETIAYGCGSLGSPKATVRAWMHSPPHKEIILSGSYRHGGVGITNWTPCGAGGTWVLDVGRK